VVPRDQSLDGASHAGRGSRADGVSNRMGVARPCHFNTIRPTR
jgi:hypothetical protein